MTLQTVRRFRIRASQIRETEDAIRSAGRDGYELFVIWSGKSDGATFEVFEVHVPRQMSYRLDDGLCVRVGGAELHRLNVWLYQAQQIIGVQVHSHPVDAYHSDTDDTYPIATLEGSLSIVLPLFGRHGFESEDIAAYRLGREGWLELLQPFGELLEVVSDGAG
ncbi:MAG: hypothetical protein OXH13_00440 [Chloroflexi bacterium]|nr:hypothetical protein [Chloroflexota bacterium]MCY3695893.1 hypothetical protein [Chloroflexota bacterium]